MPVDRCICHNVSFAELLELVHRDGVRPAELADRTGCGTGCGMCALYVELSIATGLPELPPMQPTVLRRLIDEHTAGPDSAAASPSTPGPATQARSARSAG